MKSIHFKFIWILVVILVIYGCIRMVNYYPHLFEGATGATTGATTASTTSATTGATTGATTRATTGATTASTSTSTSTMTASTTTPTPYMTMNLFATQTPTPTSAGTTQTPTPTATFTPTPIVTTPTPGVSDVGGYIQAAIDACAKSDVVAVVEKIRAAINAQTAIPNYAVVELLQVSLGYFIHYENEGTLTNWNLGKIFLYAANYILSLLSSQNVYDYGNNIQSAVKSLNTLQKDVNTAMTYTSNAVGIQQANGNTEAANFLKQAIKYLQLQLQNISVNAMSPLQMALYEYASALANLDIKHNNQFTIGPKSTIITLKSPAGGSQTETCTTTGSTTTCTSTDGSGGVQTSTTTDGGSWWNWGKIKTQYPMNVPKVVQNFLNARSMFNESDQELIDYLSDKEGYDALIKKLKDVKDEMSNL